MRRVPSGRLAGILAVLCLVIGLAAPGSVLADPPQRFQETTLNLECPLLVTGDGALSAFAFTSDLGFGDASSSRYPRETSQQTKPLLRRGAGAALVCSFAPTAN